MKDREKSQPDDVMSFKAIDKDGHKYISVDDLLVYLKDAQQKYHTSNIGFEIFQQLIRNFIGLKNDLKN